MNNNLKSILILENCEERKEKSKYFTDEFFKKNPTKYRELIEKYDVLEFQINTTFKSENEEIGDFLILGLNFENQEIERVYNDLLDFQDWLESASEEVINENIQEIRELDSEDKWDENIDTIQERIFKIGKEITDKYGKDITFDELNDNCSKELSLLCQIRDIVWLANNIKVEKFIPIHSNDNIYDANYGYNYILISKKTSKVYFLDGVESDHRPEIIKLADSFDEFIERLYLGEPFEFEDNNDYEEILRKIEEAKGNEW